MGNGCHQGARKLRSLLGTFVESLECGYGFPTPTRQHIAGLLSRINLGGCGCSSCGVWLVAAHINAMCTSTSPSNAGFATFHVGTYHDNVASAEGSICITNPAGNETCFPFGNCYSIAATTRTSTTTLDAQILANGGIPSNSAVACYEQSGGIASPVSVAYPSENQTIHMEF